MKRHFLSISIMLALFILGGTHSILGQNNAAGHWEGTLEVRGTKVNFSVDLSQKEGGAWSGTIAIPAQQLKDFSLSNVTAEGAAVSFDMAGVPGDPSFKGKLSPDGKTISGDLYQGGQSFPFTLERATGDAAKQGGYGPTPDKGVAGQGLEGLWQGTIDAPTASLRVVLIVTKAADGSFTAKMDSPDQGVGGLQVDTITLKDKSLYFEMNAIGGGYAGKMNDDGSEISGEWSQGGGLMPLTFKRLKSPTR